jgi:hypothetical protein
MYNLHVILNVTTHYLTRYPRRRSNLTYRFIFLISLLCHYAHILRLGMTLHDLVTHCGNKHVTKPWHTNIEGINLSFLIVCCVTLTMSNWREGVWVCKRELMGMMMNKVKTVFQPVGNNKRQKWQGIVVNQCSTTNYRHWYICLFNTINAMKDDTMMWWCISLCAKHQVALTVKLDP